VSIFEWYKSQNYTILEPVFFLKRNPGKRSLANPPGCNSFLIKRETILESTSLSVNEKIQCYRMTWKNFWLINMLSFDVNQKIVLIQHLHHLEYFWFVFLFLSLILDIFILGCNSSMYCISSPSSFKCSRRSWCERSITFAWFCKRISTRS